MIAKTVVKNKSVNKTYPLKDEKSYIATTSEIDGAHVLPRDISSFTNEIQQLLHDVGKLRTVNIIQPKYEQSYSCKVIQYVNR